VIVVDASVVLAWHLEDEGATEFSLAALDFVEANGGYVPGNFQSEVAQGLLLAERQKRITTIDVIESINDVLDLPLNVELPDLHTIVAAAREHRLTCYDATYLALAIRMELPLASIDEALRKAAATQGLLWSPAA
jgi:predicted nucleic acid-binding protein